jgi:hypothetical protein
VGAQAIRIGELTDENADLQQELVNTTNAHAGGGVNVPQLNALVKTLNVNGVVMMGGNMTSSEKQEMCELVQGMQRTCCS